ncbi:TRAP transporter small permease subunit [bacterium BMS3Abin03]|jgi:TRAP-type mannitol/chloroaromatic compound transport system permease small subunit|nr:TRAP transporter small permease subunit [bacterium BMS3Abin03]MCG6958578.1 TRAP transporter small permease subunit [bacterium BMS3Abin03]
MKFINIYINFIDKLNDKIGSITSWLTALLVLVVSYDVIVRYLVEESSVGLQEFEWHLFSLIFLLSAAYTLKIDDHVRVDVFYTKFSPRKQAWINFLGSILFLIPFCIVVIIASQDFVSLSFRINETSPDAGGLPARFILKAFIPISFFLLLLQGIALVFKSFLKLKEKD